MSAQERDSTDEIQQLRSKLQVMMEEKQASMMQYIREMMAELMRDNGRSKTRSAENSAAVRGGARRAEPTAVWGNSAEDSAAVRGSQRGLNPLLHDKFLLLLLLPKAEREETQHQH